METNPWYKRARKFLIAAGFMIVEIANAWADGPKWLYVGAAAVSAALVYIVGNAPKYVPPKKFNR